MTATLEEPPTLNQNDDIYLWRSWHYANSYMGSLIPQDAIKTLCDAAGDWKTLSRMVVKKIKFADIVLLAMRKLMNLPEPYVEYWEDNQWLEPTQDWVGEQIIEFVKWHLQVIGEPKPP